MNANYLVNRIEKYKMKKKIVALAFLGSLATFFLEDIKGNFSESAFIVSDNILEKIKYDVVISKDKSISKKIWTINLIMNTDFYTLKNSVNDEKKVYIIPTQDIAGYNIKIGCCF